jgi:hypothetical protein
LKLPVAQTLVENLPKATQVLPRQAQFLLLASFPDG